MSSLALLPQLVSAQVIISEIMYDAPGSDSRAEWVELQNIGTDAVDISKWKLNDGSNHVLNAPPKNGSTGSLTLQPDEYIILASDANTFLANHSTQGSVIDTVMNLGNDSGKIALFAGTTTIDKVSYSTAKGGNGTGESLQLVDGKWTHAVPTPGRANTSVRITKPATVSAAKTSTKKVASAKPEILDGTSTVAAEIAVAQDASSGAQVAAAVVPLETNSNSYAPWLYGTLALGVTGASAVFVARQKKSGEWDIEEIA